jgi:hypothetical protein
MSRRVQKVLVIDLEESELAEPCSILTDQSPRAVRQSPASKDVNTVAEELTLMRAVAVNHKAVENCIHVARY